MYLCPECLEYSPSTIKCQHGTEWLCSLVLTLPLVQLFHFEEQMQLDLKDAFHENGRNQRSSQMLALDQSAYFPESNFIHLRHGLKPRVFMSKPREFVVNVKGASTYFQVHTCTRKYLHALMFIKHILFPYFSLLQNLFSPCLNTPF